MNVARGNNDKTALAPARSRGVLNTAEADEEAWKKAGLKEWTWLTYETKTNQKSTKKVFAMNVQMMVMMMMMLKMMIWNQRHGWKNLFFPVVGNQSNNIYQRYRHRWSLL